MALVPLPVVDHVSGTSVVFTVDDVTLKLVAIAAVAVRRVTVMVFSDNGSVLYTRTFQPGESVEKSVSELNRNVALRLVLMTVGVVETKYDWPHLVEFL